MSLLWKKLNTLQTDGSSQKIDERSQPIAETSRLKKNAERVPYFGQLNDLFHEYFYYQYEILTGKKVNRDQLNSNPALKSFLDEFDTLHLREVERLATMREVIQSEKSQKNDIEIWVDIYRYIRILSFYIKHFCLKEELCFSLLNFIRCLQFHQSSAVEWVSEARTQSELILKEWLFVTPHKSNIHPMIYDEYLFLSGSFSGQTIYTELFDENFVDRSEAIETLSDHYGKSQAEIETSVTEAKKAEDNFRRLLENSPSQMLQLSEILK